MRSRTCPLDGWTGARDSEVPAIGQIQKADLPQAQSMTFDPEVQETVALPQVQHSDPAHRFSALARSSLSQPASRKHRNGYRFPILHTPGFDRVVDAPVATNRHGGGPSVSRSRDRHARGHKATDLIDLGVTRSPGCRLEAETIELMGTLATDGCAVLRIRQDTSVVQKRFGFPKNSVHQFAEMVEDSSWCETAPAVRR